MIRGKRHVPLLGCLEELVRGGLCSVTAHCEEHVNALLLQLIEDPIRIFHPTTTGLCIDVKLLKLHPHVYTLYIIICFNL